MVSNAVLYHLCCGSMICFSAVNRKKEQAFELASISRYSTVVIFKLRFALIANFEVNN